MMSKKLTQAQRCALISMFINEPLYVVVHSTTLKSLINKELARYHSTSAGSYRRILGELTDEGRKVAMEYTAADKRVQWYLAFPKDSLSRALRKGEILETLESEGEPLRFQENEDKELCEQLRTAGLVSRIVWEPGRWFYRITEAGIAALGK